MRKGNLSQLNSDASLVRFCKHLQPAALNQRDAPRTHVRLLPITQNPYRLLDEAFPPCHGGSFDMMMSRAEHPPTPADRISRQCRHWRTLSRSSYCRDCLGKPAVD